MNSRFLEQLREKNPDLPAVDFRVSIGRNPTLKTFPSEFPLQTGTIASATNAGMRIDILAKDAKEYLKNPVTFSMRFNNKGIPKIMELLRTGKAQEFTSEEFDNVKTNLQLFGPIDHTVGQKLLLASAQGSRMIPVRVTFKSESDTVQYSYMEMRMERAGSEEISIVVRRPEIPFLLRIIVSKGDVGNASFEVEPHIKGAEIHAVQKYTRAMRAIGKSGAIEIFNLETDAVAFSGKSAGDGPTENQQGLFRIIDDVTAVSDYLGISVMWPGVIPEQDADLLAIFKSLVDRSPIGKGARFTSVLKKTQENASSLDQQPPLGGAACVREEPITFFGTPLKERTFAVFMDEVRPHPSVCPKSFGHLFRCALEA